MNERESWAAKRAALARQHDEGAETALRDAVMDNMEPDLMAYRYGGGAEVAFEDALADLAEAGWRLVRVTQALGSGSG